MGLRLLVRRPSFRLPYITEKFSTEFINWMIIIGLGILIGRLVSYLIIGK